MRGRTGAFVLLAAGAIAVLAVGSYATADPGKKEVGTGPMSGYLEACPTGPVSTVAPDRSTRRSTTAPARSTTRSSYSGLEGDIRQAHIHFGQRSVNAGISAWLRETDEPVPERVDAGLSAVRDGHGDDHRARGHRAGGAGKAGEFGELVAALRAAAVRERPLVDVPGGEIRGQINDDNQRDD